MNRIIAALSVLTLVSSTGLAQSAPPRIRITEDLRLDANTEDFPVVSSILVGPRREIILPFRRDMQIRMYDSTGKRIATVGRRGDGPGEFQSIGQMGWVADTLWVYDLQPRRVTFIGPTGTVLRSTLLTASLMPPRTNVQTAGPSSISCHTRSLQMAPLSAKGDFTNPGKAASTSGRNAGLLPRRRPEKCGR